MICNNHISSCYVKTFCPLLPWILVTWILSIISQAGDFKFQNNIESKWKFLLDCCYGQKTLGKKTPCLGLEDKIPKSRILCLEGGLCCLTQAFIWFTKGTSSTGRNPTHERHAQVVGGNTTIAEKVWCSWGCGWIGGEEGREGETQGQGSFSVGICRFRQVREQTG